MYSFTKISTVADCDALLTWAESEKSDLTIKRLTLERDTTNYSSTSVEIDAILQGVLAEIAATETVINLLPEGSAKESAVKKKKRLDYKQFLLENKKESYGVVALLEREFDLERSNNEADEIDIFIAGVTAHKETL